MKTYTAYDPAEDTQYLITLYDDGSGDFATRPGLDQRHVVWSPPIALRPEWTVAR